MTNALRDARRRAGLTQRQLAERSGVAQPNIAAYESGRRRPSEAMLQRLLAAARPRPSELLARHREAILATAQHHRAHDVRVFGSVARSDDTTDSDLDLLVRFEEGASLFDHAGLVIELERLLGVHVDVISEGGLRSPHDRILAEATAL
jgi:predicted nucleotidyltransferase/DNA-binding XRE family transcriptional regulator